MVEPAELVETRPYLGRIISKFCIQLSFVDNNYPIEFFHVFYNNSVLEIKKEAISMKRFRLKVEVAFHDGTL